MQKKGSARTLNDLVIGHTATIGSLDMSTQMHKRLGGLGLKIGSEVKLLRAGSFSGPLLVRIGMTDVMIRKVDAAKVILA